MLKPATLILSAAAIALSLAAASVAEAKIRCNGSSQIIPGVGEVPTPYCEDSYLAQVAHSYGIGVSGKAIRASYNLKRDVCNKIGQDIRVQNICAGARRETGGRRHVSPF